MLDEAGGTVQGSPELDCGELGEEVVLVLACLSAVFSTDR